MVARFVADNWKSQGEQLVPDNKFAEAKMNLFIGQFMEKLGTTIFSFPATKKPNAANKAFLKILYGLQTVEASLKMHGETESGPYFFGKQYSLAETLTAPFVLRMNISERVEVVENDKGIDASEKKTNSICEEQFFTFRRHPLRSASPPNFQENLHSC